MDILSKIEGLDAKFHEVSLLITDPSVIADQARYVRLNREYHELEKLLSAATTYKKAVKDLQEARDLFHNESIRSRNHCLDSGRVVRFEHGCWH